MAIFDNFPYTNFHELNLDWFIRELKTALKKWEDQYIEIKHWYDTYTDDFDALKKWCEDYFENLDIDAEMQAKIDDVLSDMIINGTFDRLVKEVVDENLNDSPVWGYEPFYYYPVASGNYSGTDEASFLQSIATDGVYTWLFFSKSSPGTIRIDKYRNSDKTRVATASVAGGYHANGADYYDGTLYVATLDSNEILEIDPDSLQITATHTFPIGFRCVSFNNDGSCYAMSGNALYRVSLIDDSYSLIGTYALNVNTWQAGCVRNGYIYEASSNPRAIYKIDMSTGKVVRSYPIPRYVDMYCTGEIEAVTEDRDGNFYIASTMSYSFAKYRFACVLQVNKYGEPEHSAYSGGSMYALGSIYAGAYTNKGITAGTSDDPFPCVTMALMAFQSPVCREVGTFTIMFTDDIDEVMYLRDTRVNIDGDSHKAQAIYAYNCQLNLHHIEFEHTESTGQPSDRTVHLTNCQSFVHDITISQSNAGAAASATLTGGSSELYAWSITDGIASIVAYRHLFKADPTTTAYITES